MMLCTMMTVFVTSYDVVHNDDRICKINSSMFYFIVDNPAYGLLSNNIKMIKMAKCSVYQQK